MSVVTTFPGSHALAILVTVGLLTAFAAPAVAADQVVKVTLWDKTDGSQGVTLSTDKVKAGKVTFDVKNASVNQEEHELLIFKSDLTPDQLPMTQDGQRVDEDKIGHFDETGDMQPGHEKKVIVNLKPGKYILFCNEVGHLTAGMVTSFTVTP